MLYGKKIKPKELIDELGSSKQQTIIYRNGVESVKTKYEERRRVNSDAEELKEIITFRREHPETVEIRIEKSTEKSHWHVVLCWLE